jgi:ssRNA-specific RNase YbeY (16S rRNA maturation enzyme)
MGKPLVGVVGQSDNLTIRQPDNPTSATIFTVYRKTGFPTNGVSFPVDNTGQNGVMQHKTCQSSNLVFLLLTTLALVC